jgi:hypothetical protein
MYVGVDDMADLSKTEKPSTMDDFRTSKTGEDNKLDRAAEEAAEKSSKTEKRYDKDHGIFTK